MKAKIDALGDDASREDVKAAAEAFKADNKEAIEAQMAAGKALHEAIKENRPKRGEIERPEPPEEVKAKADAMRAIHKTLGDARHDLPKALKKELPNFMQPHVIHWRDILPLNPNGKLDRTAIAVEIGA